MIDLTAFILAASLVSACTSSTTASPPRSRTTEIVVASFNFPESEVLAAIYAGALREAGYHVEVLDSAGPREIVDPALLRGLVDLVPEYAGSALSFFTLGAATARADVQITHGALTAELVPRGLVPLASAPGQDANAIVVTRETATRYGLQSVSDLADVAHGMTFGGPPECPERPLCLRGLRRTYGLRFGGFVPLDTGGPLTRDALRAREIDVALLFTTDPAISEDHLVELTDDQALQPAENVTPLLRAAVLARYGPRIRALLDAVSARLTTPALQSLDAVLLAGVSPSAAAARWLDSHGLA